LRRCAALALLAAVAVAAAGCGVGAGRAPSDTRLTVTEDFGARSVRRIEAPKVGGSETVMRLLQRNLRVTTRYGGGFVQSIDGVAGGIRAGRPVDWFYYVNGIEAPRGAAATRLHPGDRVWWDRHDWGAAQRVPAVVGSFPEPFLHGIGGKRLPTRVECADPAARACDQVANRLTALGVPAARGGLRAAAVEQTLRVIVGPWTRLRGDPLLDTLERGPQASGVYARIAPDGRRIAVLDQHGRTVRTLGAGSGLIAATAAAGERPVWVVTGTDDAGVAAAVRGFEEGTLDGRFALAVSHDLPVRLPEAAGP
jgi:Domain of unknown function (DUF4430)